MLQALLAGFGTSFGLIAAIGAQNAFVLRQGLRREHVAVVVAICAASDALLIAAGVGGFGALVRATPWLGPVMMWGGAAFLYWYGFLRFKAALRGGAALMPAEGQSMPLGRVVAMCLLFTWANPHVYLDTVVLLGGISAQYAPHQWVFALAGALASLIFFSALGFGARLLAPVFARPQAWVVLEAGVGVVMWVIATTLLLRGIG